MKLFRVYMSLNYQKDNWHCTHHTPAFYVHAVDGAHAKTMAMSVANADGHFSKTSGSAVAVVDGEAIPDTYYSWCD